MVILNLMIGLVYLDDIIVFSFEASEHLHRLKAAIGRLRSARLKLKPSKCRIFLKSVSFSGLMTSGLAIASDPAKVESMVTRPVPSCLRNVRSFVGLFTYYRRFVKGFAEIASPLHKLTGKGILLQCASVGQIAFEPLESWWARQY